MKNKRLKAVLALLACICAGITAYAVEPLELHMESVAATTGGLAVYCNTNAETMPQTDDFYVVLGNTALTVQDVATVVDAGVPASYVFLVDISGSIRQAHFQAIKDTIAYICAGLSPGDNMSIFAIGNSTYTQPFVSAPDEIQAQIDAIERSGEDTNLYESIHKSLAILSTHEQCHDKKTLIVFSDGEEDIAHGITFDEVTRTVQESRIPIYTVAMLGTNPPNRYVETAKILGSFARASAGGRHYIHTLTQAMSEEIAADITDSVQNGLIVTVDLTGFQSSGEDMVLRLELTVDGMGKENAGYAISTAGLSVPVVEPSPPEPDPESEPTQEFTPSLEPEPEPATSSEPENDEEETPAEKPNNLLWIIAGSAVLLLAIIAVVIILRRKKPEESVPPPERELAMPPTAAISTSTPPPVRPNIPRPPPGKPKIALRLTKMGLAEEQVFRAEFAGELVIGRNPARSALPFKDDERLSSRHCSISYEPEGIVLRDLGSTNGTFVNGVPISGKHILDNDDILLIGSMELRVNWENV